MSTIPLFAKINYQNQEATAVSTLSQYFYLGGVKVITTNENVVIHSEQEELPWHIVALKITWFVLSFPLTLALLATYRVLRNKVHFTLPSSRESHQDIEPVFSRSLATKPQNIHQPQRLEPSRINSTAFKDALVFLERQDITLSTVDERLSIVTADMTVNKIQNDLISFLKDLRSRELLLKQSEFTKLSTEKYIKKLPDSGGNPHIGRILGRDYIEKTARDLGLKHIKVPKKLIVIKDDTNFELSVTNIGNILGNTDPDLVIYAEKIEAENRQITPEELDELIRLFEETGYNDMHLNNLIIAKDGIYIIDTEFQSFADKDSVTKGHQYRNILSTFIWGKTSIAESEALREAFEKRRRMYQNKENSIKGQSVQPVSQNTVDISISFSAVFNGL